MSTDPKTIAAYDKHAEMYAERLRAGRSNAHKYIEKPAMRAMTSSLKGKNILDLGCGGGEEVMHFVATGAERAVGVDISEGLIEIAKKYAKKRGEFFAMDMEKLDFPKATFDFVYSSLVLHYVSSWKKTLAQVGKVLKPGGEFLFSVHHPLAWGMEKSRGAHGARIMQLGFTKFSDSAAEVHGDYLSEREIHDRWFNELEVTYWNRPLSLMLADILASDLQLVAMVEPRPVEDARTKAPAFFEIYQKVPLFVIFKLKKTGK
jgi:ubiquinone/menaquinone biosynthesis C-methylase UbiE